MKGLPGLFAPDSKQGAEQAPCFIITLGNMFFKEKWYP